MADYMKRMRSNPAAQAEMIKAAQQLSQKAAATTDTNEVRDAYAELAKKQGLDPKADTVAAVKQCGVVPARPAWTLPPASNTSRESASTASTSTPKLPTFQKRKSVCSQTRARN